MRKDEPTFEVVPPHDLESASYPALALNHDATKLAFDGLRAGQRDVYYIDLSTSQAPAAVVDPERHSSLHTLFDLVREDARGWSADGWLLYQAGAGSYAVDLSRPGPGTRIALPYTDSHVDYTRWSQRSGEHRLFGHGTDVFAAFDLGVDRATYWRQSDTQSYSIAPTGTFAAFDSYRTSYIVDLDHTERPPIAVPNARSTPGSEYQESGRAAWSPDGRFLATRDNDEQLYVVRLDGSDVSTPLKIQTPGKLFYMQLQWQP